MGSNDLPYIITSVIGAFTTFGVGMLATFKIMLKQGNSKDKEAAQDRKDERKERLLLAKSINRMAVASEKGAAEAKVRNGHLGEQNVQLGLLVTHGNKTSDEILKQLQDSAITLIHDEHNKALAVKTVQVDLSHASDDRAATLLGNEDDKAAATKAVKADLLKSNSANGNGGV